MSTRSSVLPRGGAKFRSAPRTRGANRRQLRRRPDPRRRETGDMNQAADRYPRRIGRVLPADRPVPLRAAGRRLRSLWTAAPIRTARTPDLRRPGPSGGTGGGLGAGTIDPSCDPTPCPSPPVHLSRPPSPRPPEREKFARALRAFCLPRCARQGTNHATGREAHDSRKEEKR